MSPVFPRDQIEKALTQKGFTMTQGDHRFYRLMVGGKETSIRTKISMWSGYKEYGVSLLSSMKHQLKLTMSKLKDLIECPLSKEEYADFLKKNGHIRVNETEENF